jgi:endonuclease YncB( thermonuclease family)
MQKRFCNRIILFLLLAVFGHVIAITDGDTIKVLTADKITVKVRLYGIDAPEKAQDFGQAAKKHLSGLIFDKEVKVDVTDIDRYGRSIGKVYLDDKYINLEMVKAGMAWHYVQYAKHDKDLQEAEVSARENKFGLWSQPEPLEPWKFRKQ